MPKEAFSFIPESEIVSDKWVWMGIVVEETGIGGQRLVDSFLSQDVVIAIMPPNPRGRLPGLYVEVTGFDRWKSLAQWHSVTLRRVSALPGEVLSAS